MTKFVVRTITHRCPYRDQEVPLSACYIHSQDTKSDYCYGCDHVPALKSLYGLRTYRRAPVADNAHQALRFIYAPTSHDGCHWLVVDLETGERMSLGEYAAKLTESGAPYWSHLAGREKLPGAPAQFEDDKEKIEAAARAARSRGKRV